MSLPPVSIDKIIAYLYEQARLHGLSFTLLGCAVWYFHTENREMTAELQKCNDDIIRMYREDRVQMYELVENNTKALQELQYSINLRDTWPRQKQPRDKE